MPGDGFANLWMHNGWVTMSGEKMSKSLGNVLSVPNVLTQVRTDPRATLVPRVRALPVDAGVFGEGAAGCRRGVRKIEKFLDGP